MRFTPLMLLGLAGACAPTASNDDIDGSDADEFPILLPAGTGGVKIRFDIDPDVRSTMPESESAQGEFYGSVFHAEDVTVLGPVDDARELDVGDPSSDQVDITAGATEVLASLGPFEPGWYTVLGFLDTDGNAVPAEPAPDQGDPVTLPGGQNEFLIEADTILEYTVTFRLLRP